MLIDIIAASRADFIKVASVMDAIQRGRATEPNIEYRLVYSGKENDPTIKNSFLQQIGIPSPHFYLGVAGGTETEQTATIMVRYEKLIHKEQPRILLVAGGSIAATACAMTAKKQTNILVCHLDAGLRTGSRSRHDEVNRVMTDAISDYFFTATHPANDHLRNAGVVDERIFFTGNSTADVLHKFKAGIHPPVLWNTLPLKAGQYIIMSFGSAAHTEPARLKAIIVSVIRSARGLPVIFPAARRVIKVIGETGLQVPNLFVTELFDYLQFNYLVQNAVAVVTDSGNLQEEATIHSVPCLTVGRVTEREETVINGTNELVASDTQINEAMSRIFENKWKKGIVPYMWDGKTGERIASVFQNMYKTFYGNKK